MNIAICGVGGVGGYFGAKICRAKEILQANVYFIARGAHLNAIRKHGLTVRTSAEGIISCRPTLAAADIDELPPLDACLICVKGYDLKELVRSLGSRVSERTEVVPLLNGIDVYDRVREVLPKANVLPACVFIGTHIVEPGIISQDGGACRILFGRAPGETARDTPVFLRIFKKSSINNEWRDDIYPSLWSKFVFIAAFGLVTACFDKTLGQVMESAELSSRVRAVMGEILALATAQGVGLPASTLEDSYRKGSDFPSSTKTSFQRDVEVLDKPDERDLFSGTILRLGKQLGIATPNTDELSAILSRRKSPKA